MAVTSDVGATTSVPLKAIVPDPAGFVPVPKVPLLISMVRKLTVGSVTVCGAGAVAATVLLLEATAATRKSDEEVPALPESTRELVGSRATVARVFHVEPPLSLLLMVKPVSLSELSFHVTSTLPSDCKAATTLLGAAGTPVSEVVVALKPTSLFSAYAATG